MNIPKRQELSATSPEIQEDVSRDAIASAFQKAMVSHLRSHVPGTNINEQTFLAADYLNQFHELAMLLKALPADPSSFASDLNSWHAVDYEEHFNRSGLNNKELAIAAYRRSPEKVRAQFDSAVVYQSLHDRVKRFLNDFLCFQLGEANLLGNRFDDLFLGHDEVLLRTGMTCRTGESEDTTFALQV